MTSEEAKQKIKGNKECGVEINRPYIKNSLPRRLGLSEGGLRSKMNYKKLRRIEE